MIRIRIKLSSSFLLSNFTFFFHPCTMDNDTNLINRQLVIVMYRMYHVTQTMSHAWFSFENRISRYFFTFTIGLFCGISMLPECSTIHERWDMIFQSRRVENIDQCAFRVNSHYTWFPVRYFHNDHIFLIIFLSFTFFRILSLEIIINH